MIKRRLFQILPILLIMVSAVQVSSTRNCYAEAFAYIPNNDSDNLSIIKVLDNSISSTITVGGSPFGVTVGEEYIYVTNEADGTVSAISMTFNTESQRLTAGNTPRGIAVTSDEAALYVANYSENSISVIDTASNTKTAIPVGAGPLGVALSPLQDYLYVTNNGDDSLSIISTDTDTLFVTLRKNHYINYTSSTNDIAFDKPYGVAVSPDSTNIYVVNNGDGISKGTVSILSASVIYTEGSDFDWSNYDAASDTDGPYSLYAPITVGKDPRGVVVTPNQAYLYVTNYGDDTVSVISLSTQAVVATIKVGDGPYGISVTPSGDFVYVVNQLSGKVSVIDTDDNSVIKTVDVGDSPVGFGSFVGGKPPRTPSNLDASLDKSTTISITWTDNSSDELGFKILRKHYLGGTYSLLATVDKNTTTYTDSGLKADSNYYYKVYAYNYAGDSGYSNETYATTGNASSGCFIATAAYGSIMEPHVQILRDFRDRFLSTNALGKKFLNLYYSYSPPIAHYIAQHDAIRFVVRWCLLPLVGVSWLVLFIGPISTALVIGTFIVFMIFFIGYINRRIAKNKMNSCGSGSYI
jgi:YVTN family beta-propeller protein